MKKIITALLTALFTFKKPLLSQHSELLQASVKRAKRSQFGFRQDWRV